MVLPHDLQKVLESFPHALVVGGSVRDFLLGHTPKDFDLEVQHLSEAEVVEKLAPHGTVEKVGASFGVFKLTTLEKNTYDFSLPRLDNKTGAGHKNFSIQINPDLPFSISAARRDLTINALAWDPHKKILLDPFGGKNDLENQCLRHINLQFGEDPLRPLRLLQLSSRLGFRIHPETLSICQRLKKNFHLGLLPKERIEEEFLKFLLKGQHHRLALQEFEKTGWLSFFPEIQALHQLPQDPLHHPEGDVLTHTGLCLEALHHLPAYQKLPEKEKKILAFATLCHDLGKSNTTRTCYNTQIGRHTITSHNHQTTGVALTRQLLNALNQSPHTIEKVSLLVAHHMDHVWTKPTPTHVAHLAAQLSPKNPHTPHPTITQTLHHLAILVEADHHGRSPKPKKMPEKMEKILKIAQTLPCLHHPLANPLQGKDLINLGFAPGKPVSDLLFCCYQETLQNPLLKKEDLIKKLQEPEKLLKKHHRCPKCLLTSQELLTLGIPPGPPLGQTIAQLIRLQIHGKLLTKEDAKKITKSLSKKTKKLTENLSDPSFL
jgi:tRNA nucleotidyltransferase (CCA-adding enzyme)